MSESLRKAMLILETLRTSDTDLSARALAGTLGMPKSTVQRLLQSLEDTRMAIQDEYTLKYRLGPYTLTLGMAYRERFDLRNAALPHMRTLRDSTDETVGLSVAIGHERMFVEEVQSQSELRTHSELGHPYPIWTGAPGRTLLAYQNQADLDEVLEHAGAKAWRQLALSSRDELMQRLEQIVATGHDRAFDETIAGVSALAVPVRDATGGVTAALSVSGPSSRMSAEEMDRVLPEARRTAEHIGRSIGGPVSSSR